MTHAPKPLDRRQFASDNYSGVTPEAWQELERANTGHALAYGSDDWTAYAADAVRGLFDTDCEVFFTFNGTAANSLAIASLCQSYHSVICHRHAHQETDECGAPEFFSHGTKVLLADGADGKLNAASVEPLITRRSDIHYPKPRALSITQATEHGTVYTPEELRELCALAKAHDMKVHMDGARFFCAVAGLEVPPAELSWKAGVDVLCLGGTKLGMPVGDMVVFFDKTLANEFDYRCKQAGQLASKMRFLAAPWVGMLRDGTWMKYAQHCNTMARYLADQLTEIGISSRFPVQANAVFADIPEPLCQRMWEQGWIFYNFIGEGGARLMCSWDINSDDVDAFVADLGSELS